MTRRAFVAGASGLLVALPAHAALLATPPQTAGPFYPRIKPKDQDTDLTQIAGNAHTALGRVIVLQGRILSVKGHTLEGAIIEIWHADSNGRYHHPADSQQHLRDKNFQGYGAVKAGKDGRYRFRTINPE